MNIEIRLTVNEDFVRTASAEAAVLSLGSDALHEAERLIAAKDCEGEADEVPGD